jgi:hypothetical protein
MKKSVIVLTLMLAIHLHLHAQEPSSGIVNVIELSQGPNAYAMSNNITRLWADDNLNTLTFLHRVYPALGTTYLAYDLSTSGGETWMLNIPVYDPGAGGLPAYFAQGGIYNPPGNTNPELAFFTWFALTQDGQYLSGIHKLDQSSNPVTNVWDGASCSGPLAFTINPANGDVFAIAPVISGDGNIYGDSLAVSRGVFNNTTGNYDYSQVLLPLPAQPGGLEMPVDLKISFGPDGLTGYISMLFDNLSDPFAAGGGVYPVLLKTTDAGITWSGPSAVILGGPVGLPEIKNYISDDLLQILFEEFGPIQRDSVVYQTAYEHGLSVDMYGNPHICVTIGVSGVHFEQPYAINAGYGYGATFHLFSLDQGSTWIGRYITHNKTFRGCHDDLCMDNRSQVSTTADGSILVFSWSDSDFEGVYENILPDIWCQGYDVETQLFTDFFNVTLLSDVWLEAYMAVAPPIILSEDNKFLIPFALQTIPGGDPVLPVQYKYVSDFIIAPYDYILLSVLDQITDPSCVRVSQCYPNPARETTSIAIELQQPMEVKIELSNLHGQMLYSEAKGVLGSGRHVIQTDVSLFAPGIYFYTISAGDHIQTRKLVVQ